MARRGTRRRTRVRRTQAREVSSIIPKEDYQLGKLSVWWDIENCHVPKDIKASGLYTITCNIMLALKKLGHQGEISIYLYGNCAKLSPKLQRAMTSSGVQLMHVTPGEDAAAKRMIMDMMFWALENPAPATFLLMSGDSDFMYALETLYMKKYKVMIACRDNNLLYNPPITSTTWDLNSLLRGELPIGCEFYF